MNRLYFDIAITGHHSEYIRYLVNYLVKDDSECNHFFVVHPDFYEKFEDIVKKSEECAAIKWYFIDQKIINELASLSLLRLSFAQYNLMEKYSRLVNADDVYLLYFNTLQLALIFKRPHFSVHGILFLQFYRMTQNSLSEKLKYYRKFYITKLYTKNPMIKSVFVLNDRRTVDYMNKRFGTTIFRMLPDPVPQLEPRKDFDIYEAYGILKSRKIFLHIGSLSDRKGTFEILSAMDIIKEEVQKKIAILLVGKAVNQSTREYLKKEVLRLKENPNVVVVWHEDFIPNDLMKSIFDQSDIVILPYKNPEASSGILGHAISSKKPVIITGKGLLKEIVESNNFGSLLDEVSAYKIAEMISQVFDKNQQRDNDKYESYLREHTPERFANTFLGNY